MPAGYTPYTPMYQPYSSYQAYQPQYQPSIVQQPPQTVQQPTQAPQGQASILWVRNAQEAAMYPVAPNNAVALWDSGIPAIYLKQADASGKPTMKIYDLVERVETPQEPPKSPAGDFADYATKAELAALAGVVKDVDGLIASIREEVDALKSEPAKKRAVKKEAEADG